MRQLLMASAVAVFVVEARAGGVESHPFNAVWDWNEQASQFAFSVNPVPLFDDQGGTRRLGRVKVQALQSWEATMLLNNSLPVRQCVDYTNYNVVAGLDTLLGDIIIAVPDGVARGRFGADAGQQASRSVSASIGGGAEWIRRHDEPQVLASIGSGFVPIGSAGASSGFDTFRVLEADPQCNGGILSGGPQGFSTPIARFEWLGVWEYHWLDANCPVDLTTVNQPSFYLYGVPDGILDSEDFFYFLAQFTAGNAAVADMTTTAIPGSPAYGVPNGIINNDDFFYFLTLFAAGC